MEASSIPRRGGLALPRALLARAGDERLVEQLRRGNPHAFEVIYDRYHRGLLSFCRHMLGNREEAEDALQHALFAAHEDILRSDKPIRLKAWLYTIARNRCLSVLRARREQPSDEIEISTAGLSESVQHRADVRELLGDLSALPEDQRAALVLSELGDLSHAEVAAVVGCEVAKVKSLVFQARSALMERRDAREIPCQEIREQLANLRGGALRRSHLRHHVASCQGCAEYRDEVKRQRKVMAAVLPVIPTLGLKNTALAAVGSGGGGGAAVATAGGGIAAIATSGAAKVALIAVMAAGAATGGSVASGNGVPLVGSTDEAAESIKGPDDGGVAPVVIGELTSDNAAAEKKAAAKKASAKRRARGHSDRGREWAKTRGKGRKLGLYKERSARARARGRTERAKNVPHTKVPSRGRSTEPRGSKPDRGTTPVTPAVPKAPVQTAPEPVVPAPPPPAVPGGSGGKGGGGKLKKTL